MKLDLTPTWYGDRAAREELLPNAVALVLQSEVAGMRREIRLHLDGIELEALNVVERGDEPFDVRAHGAVLRERIERLRP